MKRFLSIVFVIFVISFIASALVTIGFAQNETKTSHIQDRDVYGKEIKNTSDVNAMDTLTLLFKLWPIVFFMIGVVFNSGALLYMVLNHKKQIKELKRVQDKMIISDQGQPIYTPYVTCLSSQQKCLNDRNREYQHLADQIKDLKQTIDNEVKQTINNLYEEIKYLRNKK